MAQPLTAISTKPPSKPPPTPKRRRAEYRCVKTGAGPSYSFRHRVLLVVAFELDQEVREDRSDGVTKDTGPKSHFAEPDWSAFDSKAYVDQNYVGVREDDRALIELAIEAFRDEPSQLEVVDIGTGPNLYPLLAALPRARRLTAWELSPANIAWLKAEIAAPALRPVWLDFWNIVRNGYGESLPATPHALLQDRFTPIEASVFDLPPGRWDAASMFFCAESITDSVSEFERALEAWSRCAKPGGRLIAAFMENSTGYTIAGRSYPATCLTADAIAAAVSPLVSDAAFTHIPRPPLVREGYSGMLFACGRAR